VGTFREREREKYVSGYRRRDKEVCFWVQLVRERSVLVGTVRERERERQAVRDRRSSNRTDSGI